MVNNYIFYLLKKIYFMTNCLMNIKMWLENFQISAVG